MTKFLKSNLISAFLLILISPVFFVSCNKKDDTSALEAEARVKWENLKTKYGMTLADSIGYGVYLKFVDPPPNDTARAGINDYALISYTGYNSDGSIIETSDSVTAKSFNIYYDDIVYGPNKISVGGTIAGVRLALLNMPPNSEAIVVIPADMAYGNFDPVMYHIKLYKIIKDNLQFEIDQREAYKKAIDFSGTYNSDSTIEYKIIKNGTVSSGIEYYKKVTLELHAYYAEVIDSLQIKNPGRQFFPIAKVSDSFYYYYHYSQGFPLSAAIDSMVSNMKLSEEREFITSSDNAYGESGFTFSSSRVYVVPPYTSIHYKIKLLSVE